VLCDTPAAARVRPAWVFTPAELWAMSLVDGRRALRQPVPAAVGSVLDLVELDAGSVRTVGSRPEDLVMTASASDVRTVITKAQPLPHLRAGRASPPRPVQAAAPPSTSRSVPTTKPASGEAR
jgi:hypothetical protein